MQKDEFQMFVMGVQLLVCPPKVGIIDLVEFLQNSISVNARRIELCISEATGETLVPIRIIFPSK